MIPRTSIVSLLCLWAAGLAWAVQPAEPLDRALAGADLVVVGKLGKLTPIEGAKFTSSGEIPVTEVLKGPADLKTVTLRTVDPQEARREGLVGAVIRNEGDSGVWILRRHIDKQKYVAPNPTHLQPLTALDEVKRILKAQGTLTQPAASAAGEGAAAAGKPSAPPGMSREEMVKRAAVIVVGTLQPYDKRVLLPARKGDQFRYSVVDIQVEEVLKGAAGLKTVPLRNCVGFVEPFHESTPGVYQSRGREPRGIWVLTPEGGQYVGACFDVEDKAKIVAMLRPGAAPADAAAQRAEKLKAAVKEFRLHLYYRGPEDKPFYRLTLSTQGLDAKPINDFYRAAVVTEKQAREIIDLLAAEGFLTAAKEWNSLWNMPMKWDKPQGYVLQVSGFADAKGNFRHNLFWYEELGWDLAMLKRLDGLRKPLDGQAAREMDLLLGRLSGLRERWQAGGQVGAQPVVVWGKEVNGVQAGLRPVKAAFEPQEAIELEIRMRNVGDKPVNLTNAGSPYIAWQVTFQRTGAGASPTLLARWTQAPVARLRPVPVALAKGEEKTVRLAFDAAWAFEDQSPRRRGKQVEPLTNLPEGVYEVTAAYTQGAPSDKEWWGTLIAGPAKIVIGKVREEPDPPAGKTGGDGPATAPAVAGPATRPAPSAAEVAALIAQLGSDDWRIREAAGEKLIAAGKPARAALEAKAREKGLDPEVASRLEFIMERLLGDAAVTDAATGITVRILRGGEVIEGGRDGKRIWQTGVPAGGKDLKIEKGNVKVLPIHWTLDIKTGKVINIGTQEGRIIRLGGLMQERAGGANAEAERLAREAAKAAALDAAMRDRQKAEEAAAAAKQAEEEAKRKAQAEEAARRVEQDRN